MCTILCVIWQGFGFGLPRPSPLPVVIVGVGPRLKYVKYCGITVSARDCEGVTLMFDHYAPPVATPRRQSCASEQIAAAFSLVSGCRTRFPDGSVRHSEG
jgi:hypothetical protein